MTPETTTLDWIDAALEAGAPTTGDPRGRDLQELALALRAETPTPDPRFAESLAQRVDAGFPRRRPRLRISRPPKPAIAGALATVTAAAAIAIGVSSDNGGGAVKRTPVVAEPLPAVGPSHSAQQRSAAHAPLSARRVQRGADLTLSAPEKDLQKVADRVAAVTTRHRGFVLRSDVSTGEGGAPGGSLDLRVPVTELEPTLADLSGLAHVAGRSESAQDVTQQYNDLTGRLAKARAQRASLERRIAGAGAGEADALRPRLAVVNGRIRRLSDDLATFNRETNFATISVTLEAARDGAAAGSGTKRALHDSVGLLVDTLDVAIRAAGVLVPLALLGALAWVAAGTLRRRRREAILG